MSEVKTNYRHATRAEIKCRDCAHSILREQSLRLECPHRKNYLVGMHATCDLAKEGVKR